MIYPQQNFTRFLDAVSRSATVLIITHVNARTFLGEAGHAHAAYYQLSCVMAGHTTLRIAGRAYQAAAGTVLLVPPGVRHASVEPSDGPELELAQLKFMLRGRHATGLPHVMRIGDMREFTRIFQCLLDEYHMRRPYPEHQQRLLLAELLLWMCREQAGGVRRRAVSARDLQHTRRRREQSRRVTQFIHAHYQRKLTLADLARAAGVSISALTHEFRRHAGVSPMQYLLHYRLTQAALRLRAGAGVKLRQVALATGFADEYYFSRQFKKRFKVSPGAYMR